MNEYTIRTYQENYKTYKEKTPNEVTGGFVDVLNSFLETVPTAGGVLELGSAHGRDARFIKDRGYDILCTDIIPDALTELAAQGFQTKYLDLSDTESLSELGTFDGIFANAVLHHFDEETFLKIIKQLYKNANEGAAFAFTVKEGSGEEVENEKLGGDRYFKYWTTNSLSEALNKTDWKVVNIGLSPDGKWVNVLCKK